MKNQLRKETIVKRLELPEQDRKLKSAAVIKRVKALPEVALAKTVMLYLDFRGEVETLELVEDLLKEGKIVAVPVCNPDKTITPTELKDLEHDLQSGAWGIQEPKADRCKSVNPDEIDIVLVPGVAFDSQGNRLGYGAGYYDRFVLRLRPGVPLVALAFELQVLPVLTPDPHDRPMTKIVTEDRVINC